MNRYQGKREAPRPESQRPSHQENQPARHTGSGTASGTSRRGGGSSGRRPSGKKSAGRKALLVIGIVVAVIAALILVFLAVWKSFAKPPEITTPDSSGTVDIDDPNLTEEERLGLLEAGVNVDEELPEYISNQKEGVYTFLLIGRTRMDDNADMLMLIVFDTNTGEIDACSIPRDTMVNLSADVKKINSTIFGGVSNTKNWVRKTLGVYPNFYVMVDWQAVGDLVQAVGGVYFDVPIRMHYIDKNSKNGFTIDLWDGYQLLDGDKAMQLIRWRKNNVYQWEINAAKEAGFDGSDTKRTQMQQEFIVAAAKQILQVKNLPYLGSMVQVFKDNVETDLSIGNLAWFAQKALELGSAEKVTFHTLPANYNGSCYSRTQKNYQSYVTFKTSELVTMVNTYLNPYETQIKASDLDHMRINSDGTISSSTGSLADTKHNNIVAHLDDINNGLAYLDKDYNVVYYETEDPGTTDPGTGTTDPGTGTTDPGTGTTDPGTGTTDPGTGTTDPGATDPGTGAMDPEATDPGTVTVDPSDPGSSNYDPWQDPNYNPDPWAGSGNNAA